MGDQDPLAKAQHELDNLHRDMAATRVRDGLKMQIYADFKNRVEIIGKMLQEARSEQKAPS